MPIIESKFTIPKYLRNGHVQSIYPYLFRNVSATITTKERIITADKDFIDLDEYLVGSDSMAIISHGMEGASDAHYMKGMVNHLNSLNIDALAWNMRSCSGEMNLTEGFYHSAQTEDLEAVVNHVQAKGIYKNIYLVGFSLGANLNAIYVGKNELAGTLPKEIKSSVMISNPCDIKCSSKEIGKLENILYSKFFLKTMSDKVKLKDKLMGFSKINIAELKNVKTLEQFNNLVTAPLHGFKDTYDYYRHASSKQYLKNLQLPSLIINSKDDPFFGDKCYPTEEASQNKNLFLEMTQSGGHVGFYSPKFSDTYWHEIRTGEFLLK
jgi:predicted alpha/beta-fold hydrolase